MHRSSSYNRVPDDDYAHAPPMASHIPRTASFQSGNYDYKLPSYNPVADVVRKEKPRTKLFAENAVHVIPFMLLLCAIILWFLSGAVKERKFPEVGMDKYSVAARIEGMTIEGGFDTDVDGTSQTGLLPLLDAGDDDTSKQSGGTKNPRKSKK